VIVEGVAATHAAAIAEVAEAPPTAATLRVAIRAARRKYVGGTESFSADIYFESDIHETSRESADQRASRFQFDQRQHQVGRLGLILLASENLAITGSTVARFHITNGRSPAEIIPALAAIQLVAVAQPNYVYTLAAATRGKRAGRARRHRPEGATPRNTSSRNSRSPTFTAWSGAPISRSR
jgi:hypothetical protein